MKKIMTLLLISTMAVTFVACSSNKPSEEDVIAAIEAGTLTTEDAIDKGYVDEQWVEDYYAENSVPAMDKSSSNMLSAFETETLASEKFTNEDLSPVTFIAFLNPTSEDAKEQYKILLETYEDVVTNGGDILVVNTSNEASDLFDDATFNVVSYNESMKSALGNLSEMVNEDGFTGSWNVRGAFMSAWYMKVEADGFADTAKSMVESYGEPKSDSTEMQPMG